MNRGQVDPTFVPAVQLGRCKKNVPRQTCPYHSTPPTRSKAAESRVAGVQALCTPSMAINREYQLVTALCGENYRGRSTRAHFYLARTTIVRYDETVAIAVHRARHRVANPYLHYACD